MMEHAQALAVNGGKHEVTAKMRHALQLEPSRDDAE
jgi:hypothetical protein